MAAIPLSNPSAGPRRVLRPIFPYRCKQSYSAPPADFRTSSVAFARLTRRPAIATPLFLRFVTQYSGWKRLRSESVRTALICVLMLSLRPTGEVEAQAGKRRLYVIPDDVIVSASAMRKICFEHQPQRPETLTVMLGFAPRHGSVPRWWPQPTTAMLERMRPNEVRGGVNFARFRVIRIDLGATPIRGRLGTVVPVAEEMGNAVGREVCVPFEGLGFYGTLAKPLRYWK